MAEMTAIIFHLSPDDTKYFIASGDWTEYKDVYINSGRNAELESALCSHMYDADGNFLLNPLDLDTWFLLSKPATLIIECGFIL